MRYAIGIDFGTESGRAVLVDVATGAELGDRDPRVRQRRHRPPAAGAGRRRRPRAGLGAPGSRRLRRHGPRRPSRGCWRRPASTRRTSSASASTSPSCTMLPTTADGTPLCRLPELRREPHAWVKLWKHHAAQPEADRINAAAAARGEAWLPRYGGRISSEWFFSKSLQILDEAPRRLPRRGPADRGRRLDRLAADRGRDPQLVHRRLQGDLVEARRLPRRGVLRRRSSPRFASIVDDKMSRDIRPIGERAGGLSAEAAALDRAAARDAGRGRQRRRPRLGPGGRRHRARARWSRSWARAPATWCWVDGSALAEGMCGVVEDGIIPGLLRLRGGPVGGRRHLRLVHRSRPSRPRSTSGRAATASTSTASSSATPRRSGRARPGCSPSTGGTAIARSSSTSSSAACSSGRRSRRGPADIYRALLESTAFGTRRDHRVARGGGRRRRPDRRLRRAARAERAADAALRRHHRPRVRRRGVGAGAGRWARRCTARSRPGAARGRLRLDRGRGRGDGPAARPDLSARIAAAAGGVRRAVPRVHGAARLLRARRQRRDAAPAGDCAAAA